MQIFKDLPEGLWLIKWIDRFSLGGRNAESPFVDVVLQKLPTDNLASIAQFSSQSTGTLLGKKIGAAPQDSPTFRIERILAGYLPLLRIGRIVQGGAIVGCLPSTSASLILKSADDAKSVFTSAELPAPTGWSTGSYTLLNKFDFNIGNFGFGKSECLVIRTNNRDFIIPRKVIFQTFFGFCTPMINALCGSSWPDAAKKIISFDNYESGIHTGIDEKTGEWRIVLKAGMTEDLAPAMHYCGLIPLREKKQICCAAMHFLKNQKFVVVVL